MSASTAASVSVVLVHGGFVDGSGWQGVYNSLRQHGYRVGIVQNPTISLDDDVAVTKRVIAAQPGPVVLVGHSYGGVVITQAGNDPKVAGLVYIAAFAPDKGESVATLIANPPPGAPAPPILPPQDGFLLLDSEKFAASFAADVPADLANFMANSQVPWGVQALEGKVSEASWKSKPSWYLVATDDRMIPPPAQQFMSKRAGSTVVESKGSHSVYVSQPGAVAALPPCQPPRRPSPISLETERDGSCDPRGCGVCSRPAATPMSSLPRHAIGSRLLFPGEGTQRGTCSALINRTAVDA